jgi:hypothetical protein
MMALGRGGSCIAAFLPELRYDTTDAFDICA